MKLFYPLSLTFCLLTTLSGCSTVPKANISATENPDKVISDLQADIRLGYQYQYDVLAEDDFKQSRKYLKEAQEDLKDNDANEEIIKSLAISKGYYDRASEKASQRSAQTEGILNARNAALVAGARKYSKHNEKLTDLDDTFRGYAKDLKDMDKDEFSVLQNNYLSLESDSTQTRYLGRARAQIKKALELDAEDNTPTALKAAQTDLSAAENVINKNIRDKENFRSEVVKANNSAALLLEIAKSSQADGKILPESVARDIVLKNRKLVTLNNELDETESDLVTSEYHSNQLSQTVVNQHSSIAINNAIKAAALEMPKDKAEVFRQGDNLLIRLKGMHFATGNSSLPKDSIPLLAKVKDIAQELKASTIVVEGHTDDVGGKALNKKLSQERAETVAKYLGTNGIEKEAIEARGFGYEKPLSTNKTKIGRASNRRVDIILTPSLDASTNRNKNI